MFLKSFALLRSRALVSSRPLAACQLRNFTTPQPQTEQQPEPKPDTPETPQLQKEDLDLNAQRTASYMRNMSKGMYEDYVQKRTKWTDEECDAVTATHVPCEKVADYLAFGTVKVMRFSWDLFSGYTLGHRMGLFKMSFNMWVTRVVFLETVAGVPGMMFGMARHLRSLRKMQRDGGWIHTLLSEAENERMHLLTFIRMKNPSAPFRYMVLGAQGIVSAFLFVAYMVSPRYCHRFVGYLEEEAVHTYTTLLKEVDSGRIPQWQEPATELAIKYWGLPQGATWRQVLNHVRMDESHHRDVNHDLAPIARIPGAKNPHRNEWT